MAPDTFGWLCWSWAGLEIIGVADRKRLGRDVTQTNRCHGQPASLHPPRNLSTTPDLQGSITESCLQTDELIKGIPFHRVSAIGYHSAGNLR